MTRDEAIFRILDRYRFTEPVDAHTRAYLPKSQKRALKYCLKKTGNYSLWFGIVLFILFAAKRFGIKMTLATSKVIFVISATVAAAAIVTGGTAVVTRIIAANNVPVTESVNPSVKPSVQQSAKPEATESQLPQTEQAQSVKPESEPAVIDKPVPQTDTEEEPALNKERMEIILYTGRVYRGIIVSRGQTIVISTPQGEVRIPSNKVRMIRPAGE